MPRVDLSHYKQREQAYVKHCLLEEYLPHNLIEWLKALDPHVRIRFELSEKRTKPKKPSPMHDDRAFVVNPQALR